MFPHTMMSRPHSRFPHLHDQKYGTGPGFRVHPNPCHVYGRLCFGRTIHFADRRRHVQFLRLVFRSTARVTASLGRNRRMSLRAPTGYEAGYLIVWGTNLPMTRTPDAHFYSEGRYTGTKTAAVAPDYAEYVKFADTWLPAKAGTDSALAMAMTFVILKEFYIDRQSDYFASYAKAFTDLPFAVILKQQGDQFVSDRFLRASDLGLSLNNAEWKTVYFDANSRKFVVPNGSIGFRWNEEGTLESTGPGFDEWL